MRCLFIEPKAASEWTSLIYRFIASRLAANGIACDRYRISLPLTPAAVGEILDLITRRGDHDFIFNINRIPANMIRSDHRPGQSLFALAATPVVTWLIDNIAYHSSLLKHDPPGRHERVFVMDGAWMDLQAHTGIRLADNSFFPMWGPPREDDLPPFEERPIPVLFAGGLGAEEPVDGLLERTAGRDQALRRGIADTIEQMMEEKGRTDVLAALAGNLQRHGRGSFDITLFIAVDQWLRTWARRRLLRSFVSTPIVVCGAVEDAVLASRPNVTLEGAVPMHDLVPMARRARVLLGDCVCFTRGVEFRPSLALSTGCVLAVEANRYLGEVFPADALVDIDPADATCDEGLAELLSDPHRLAAIAGRADVVYQELISAPLPFLDHVRNAKTDG